MMMMIVGAEFYGEWKVKFVFETVLSSNKSRRVLQLNYQVISAEV